MSMPARPDQESTMLALLVDLVVRETDDSDVHDARSRLRETVPTGSVELPRVPLDDGLRLWARIGALTNDDTIGLRISERAPLACFHYFGAALASAPHLFAALQVYCRYSPYLFTPAFICEHIEKDIFSISWDSTLAPDSLRDFILSQISDLIRQHGVRSVRPHAIELPGPVPNHWVRYVDRFQCPVSFGANFPQIQLRTTDLTVPLLGANAAMHTAVVQRLNLFDRVNRSLIGRTVSAIEQYLDRGAARIETVSQALNRSPRSLQQHLAEEGYKFSDLLREVRKRRAIHLLGETDLSMTRVAMSLGYRDTGSFSRAFQEWLGQTPASFRRSSRTRALQSREAQVEGSNDRAPEPTPHPQDSPQPSDRSEIEEPSIDDSP
jgi:AraC-like DNA-binding protein